MAKISYEAKIGSKQLMTYDEEPLTCCMCNGSVDTDRDLYDDERGEWACMKCN